MPRYRIKYEKSQEASFFGHLDTMKNFERAFRRARIPIAFSQGFNPHPKIAFASPLAVGVTGGAEYVDIQLKEEMEPHVLQGKITGVMPPGFNIIDIKQVDEKLPALMAQIRMARYDIEVPLALEYTQESLEEEIKKLVLRSNIQVERETKKGIKPKDIKEGLHKVTGEVKNNKLILDVLLDSGSENNIRPEEVLKAIKEYTDIPIDDTVSRIHRKGVFINKNIERNSPMADLMGEE